MRYATVVIVSVVAFETDPKVIREGVIDNMRQHARRETGSDLVSLVETKMMRDWIELEDGIPFEVIRIHALWETSE